MRLLDLGAHDGFVSAYVADHYHGDLHIDGVELNSKASEIFNRRLKERGIPGLCVYAMAEDAANFFEVHSYDAVVAFELIEHVADVDFFLDRCEEMVAPGGRIYLSTPDGTFGAGQNPHHLRVYRAVDLAEILRRRGEIEDMGVGPDGITIAAYTPWAAMTGKLTTGPGGEVAIYTGAGWKPWSPLNIEMPGGLGGSETAAVRLGEALTRMGYTVTTYGEVEPGAYGQVIYRHHSTFDPMVHRDALIVSRAPWMGDRPINAERVLLWMHDTDYGPEMTEKRAERFDKVMVLSQWQRGYVAEAYPFLADKLVVTGNAITPRYFDGEAPERNDHRAIYSSSPDRGLDLLLDWWPAVREHDPNAELVFCYADVYAAVAAKRPDIAAHHALIMRLADQPGVTNLGALSQPQLAYEMRMSGVWLAPSFTTPNKRAFYETFCIGAVEAAAAGCHIIVSDWGALPERMATANGCQMLRGVDGDVPDKDRWVRAIAHMMRGQGAPLRCQSPSAIKQTWDVVARDFVAQMHTGVLVAR